MANHSSWAGTADSFFGINFAKFQFSRRSWKSILFIVGLGFYLSTALVNIGIIALDDYEFGIARTIPAQTTSYSYIISQRAIRSPTPTLILAFLGKLGLSLGLQDPADQLRFVLFAIAFISFLTQSRFVTWHFSGHSGIEPQARNFKQEISLFLIGCYFLCPLFYSRPMVENLCAPFLTMSAYFACVYFATNKRSALVFAVITITISAMLRSQAGVCFIGLLGLVAWKRSLKDWIALSVAGLVCFVLSGALDWYLTGTFHGSLLSYVDYNIKYSSVYGVQPFYVFTLLLLAVTIPPTLLSKYRGFDWKTEYQFLIPTLVYLLTFLIAHSLVPHKEDRFMVPILGIILILMTPLLNYFLVTPGNQWRVWYFLGLNLILLPLASYNIAQNNTIGLVRFLHHNPQIKTVVGVDETLLLYPKAFSLSPVTDIKMSSEDVSQLRGGDCDSVIAVRHDLKNGLSNLDDFYSKVAEFRPGILEQIIVLANPKRNFRRGAIEVYADKQCQF